MSTLRSRYAALAGVASLMLGASIATAGAASAVVPHYGEHGADVTAVTAYNNADVLAVTSGAYDAPVVAGAAGSASEFVVRKSGDVIVLEYAPFGFAGTPALCVSDPGPGYGAADVIELRDCNGSIFQQFTEFSDGNGYVSLRDNATHQFITDEGQGVGVAGIKDGVVGEPGNNSPSFAADQLWKVGAARAYVAPQSAGYQGCNLHLGAHPDIHRRPASPPRCHADSHRCGVLRLRCLGHWSVGLVVRGGHPGQRHRHRFCHDHLDWC